MNKTVLKIFISFSVCAAVIATILLCINAFGMAVIFSDTSTHIHEHSPQGMIENIGNSLTRTDEGFVLYDKTLLDDSCWCILLNDNGDIIWSQNQPDDIPTHYSIRDIARLTKWFLNDYPVYVRAEDYGLLILGIPKNAVGKYDMAYSMDWFNSLPQRVTAILMFNIALALILAFAFGIGIYKSLKRLTLGIKDLRNEKSVKLSEKGIFKELAQNINKTSNAIERKNQIIAERDNARLNWIAGISHDIRTPLAVIMGNAEALHRSDELSPQSKDRALTILNRSIKVKEMVEDLNLASSLEYDMQPVDKKDVRICPLIRGVASDIMNNSLSDKFEITLNLDYEKAVVSGDETLLERALFNILNNAVKHNGGGCVININQYREGDNTVIHIKDNGKGVNEKILENIDVIPKSAHGLGLPLSYKIIRVHGGSFEAYNDNGFNVKITLPR